MTKLYLATAAAVVVTTSVASNILLVGTRNNRLRLAVSAQARLATRRWSRQLKQLVDAWVAGRIARRKRRATLVVLYRLTDRELLDIGMCRDSIEHAVHDSEHDWIH